VIRGIFTFEIVSGEWGRKKALPASDWGFLGQQNFYETIPSSQRNRYPLVQFPHPAGAWLEAQLYHIPGKKKGDADLKLGATLSRKPFCLLFGRSARC